MAAGRDHVLMLLLCVLFFSLMDHLLRPLVGAQDLLSLRTSWQLVSRIPIFLGVIYKELVGRNWFGILACLTPRGRLATE